MKELIVKFVGNGLLIALGVFSAAMLLIAVRGADPAHAWVFWTLGVAGFVIVGVMIWGRRALLAVERRGERL
ncbi:MAG TPA: hypothetical protein VFA38_08660 [Nitrospirales bacterium]|nr:hypothetical protein [Nitrospirales bacterium]